MNNENHWSREKEDMLKTYAEESECLFITYTKDYKKYRLRGYVFTIPAIIISTVTGLLSFDKNFNSSENGSFVIGGFNILVAVMATIYKVLKYAEFESQFNFLSNEHLKLHSEIQAMLVKKPEERDSANEFIRKIESKRLELINNPPILTDNTRNFFLKKYKNSNINIPLLLRKINPIKIYGRDDTTPISTETPKSSSILNVSVSNEIVV
jgi:hypothetical protein